jgi:anti-anti-sigma factor
VADAEPPIEQLPVTATVTDLTGNPILTVTLLVEPADPAGPSTVVAKGEVDLDTGAILRTALIAAADRHRRVYCDLSGVTFFGAAGINALVAGHRRAVENGAELEVRGAHGMTRRVLQLTGLNALLTGHP